MKGVVFLFFVSCVIYAHAKPVSMAARLAKGRIEAHQSMANNPFDFTVDWDPTVWSNELLDEVKGALTIINAKVTWENRILNRLSTIPLVPPRKITRCHVVLDKDAYYKVPDG